VVRSPAITAPASTTEAALLLLLALGLASCGLSPLRRQPATPAALGAESREQPALSGDGRLLATLVERAGRTTVLLQERRSGKVLPLQAPAQSSATQLPLPQLERAVSGAVGAAGCSPSGRD